MAVEFIDVVETSLAGLGTGALMALTGVAALAVVVAFWGLSRV